MLFEDRLFSVSLFAFDLAKYFCTYIEKLSLYFSPFSQWFILINIQNIYFENSGATLSQRERCSSELWPPEGGVVLQSLRITF